MVKKLYSNRGFIGVFLLALIVASLPSSFVSAVSVYDDVFNSTSSVGASSHYAGAQCDTVDLSDSWSAIILNESYWSRAVYGDGTSYADVSTALQNALNNESGVSVAEREIVSSAQVGGVGGESGDTWVEVVISPDATNYTDFGIHNNQKYALMRNETAAPVYVVIIGRFWNGMDQTCSTGVAVSRKIPGNSPVSSFIIGEVIIGHDNFAGRTGEYRQFFVNSPINYPVGYAGQQPAVLDMSSDVDADGLMVKDELKQGTSSANKDTDNDGLSDYVESQWYTNRQSIFCGSSCTYPNPIKKDIFVEVDWMKDGSRSFKPSSAQLADVVSMFDAKDINLHFDTGQYGGGNELPSYAQDLHFVQNPGQFDFFDYKNGTTTTSPNFNGDRKRIWHYLISGYQYHDITGSSGVSYVGDDDLFVSYGLIEDGQNDFDYNDLDTAISGTIAHELGHNLCLSPNSEYALQDSRCIDSKIDTDAVTTYDSVMNYTTQMFMVDYSDGVNGLVNDHDDWSAVLNAGIADFSETDRDFGDAAGADKGKKAKKLVRGITKEEAKALKQAGKLGGKYK